MGGLSLGT